MGFLGDLFFGIAEGLSELDEDWYKNDTSARPYRQKMYQVTFRNEHGRRGCMQIGADSSGGARQIVQDMGHYVVDVQEI